MSKERARAESDYTRDTKRVDQSTTRQKMLCMTCPRRVSPGHDEAAGRKTVSFQSDISYIFNPHVGLGETEIPAFDEV